MRRARPSAPRCPLAGSGEGSGDHGGRDRPAPLLDVEDHRRLRSELGPDEGQGDPVFEHGREVPAGHRPGRPAVLAERRSPARGLAPLGGQADQPAGHPGRSRSASSGAPPEVPLVPSHHPPQSGLEGGDARAQFVAVERKPGLEAQGVAGTEAGGRRCRRRARPSTGRRRRRRVRHTRRRPRPCSRFPRPRTAPPPRRTGRPRNGVRRRHRGPRWPAGSERVGPGRR